MRKLLLALFMLSGFSVLVTAHEFWLESDRFYFQPGETAHITFRVGEDFIGESQELAMDRVKRMEHHTGNEIADLKPLVKGNQDDPVAVRLSAEGSHVFVMETNPLFIEMDGKKFTTHLEEDGLDEVLYHRKGTQSSADSATEYYSRHTKLILQAGSKADENYQKVCNLPIEIIPAQNPSVLKKGDRISFKILFQGKPLFGAKVKVWNRYKHRISVQNIFSQQDGMIETHVSNPGAWMVSVVRMVPSDDPKAQYRSYWGTLVFGVR